MNVPKLRFSKFNDEWKKVDLKNIFNYFSTNSLSREQLSNNGAIKNIHYGDIHKKFPTIVDVDKNVDAYIKDINYVNKYELCKNYDLIFADASEDYEGIGKAIEITNIKCNTISGLHTILARDNSNSFAPKFKGYYFNSPVIHNQIRILANGFKVYGISKETINKLNIKIPTIEEQEKIANTLELLDKKIELQTKKIEDLKLFTKKAFNTTISKEFFNYKRLDEIFDIHAGGDIKKENISETQSNTFCYPIYSNNLENDGIYGFSNVYKVAEDSITVTGRGDIGKAKYRKAYFYPIVRLLVLTPKIPINFVFYQEVINNIKIIQESTGVPQLTSPQISKYKVIFPEIEIQNKIGKMIEKIEKKIELESIKLFKLQLLKKGLMQNIFV